MRLCLCCSHSVIALVFTITGEESAQWTQRGDHHSRYQEFLKHEILANVLPNPYLPGEYLYPFSYTLPADVPGVLDADSLDGGDRDLRAMHATIKYTLKASIKVEGRFVSDLEATHALVVREKHQAAEAISHGVERTVSKRVRLLGCINRGTCHVAASMKKNVMALGDTTRVDIFVNNHTSAASIKHVSCRVYQDVTIADPKGSGVRKVCSRPLLQVRCNGPRSGELLERPMDLVLAGKLRFPSTQGSFIQCSYRMSLECELFLAKTIKIDIPVTILPAQGPLRPLHLPREPLLLQSARTAAPLPPVPSSAASSSSSAASTASSAPYAHLVAPPRTPVTIDLMA